MLTRLVTAVSRLGPLGKAIGNILGFIVLSLGCALWYLLHQAYDHPLRTLLRASLWFLGALLLRWGLSALRISINDAWFLALLVGIPVAALAAFFGWMLPHLPHPDPSSD